jgi:bifunctional UDP-N-acetylglucosamine pyrophosphorylase/glucosamine-1-phosphate N-acetyltransferase
MKSPTPKVLFDVCGLPSVAHVARIARELGAARMAMVVPPDHAALKSALDVDATYVVQDPPLGTGHAVLLAVEALGSKAGDDVIVLCADGPLYRTESLKALLAAMEANGAAAAILTAQVADPRGYGRIVPAADGGVERIVEELEADAATRAIREINTGILAFRADEGVPALRALTNANRKGEYYLTDIVERLRAARSRVARSSVEDPSECAAFNSIAELAEVRRLMRMRILREHMERGVDVVDPASTHIEVDVAIGAGTRILPFTVITHGVKIGQNCVIGPFAHIQSATVLDDAAEIGNFVEVKRSRVGKKTKAKHLTYLGDAQIGPGVNIGAGTITANYDGKAKHSTTVGPHAFIGSGTVLVAPVDVGERAMTGAGAIVRRGSRIGAGEVWVGVPARKLDRTVDASGGGKS